MDTSQKYEPEQIRNEEKLIKGYVAVQSAENAVIIRYRVKPLDKKKYQPKNRPEKQQL